MRGGGGTTLNIARKHDNPEESDERKITRETRFRVSATRNDLDIGYR